jgi:pilus assembly protein CpaB
MSVRRLLLFLGILLVIAGLGLSLVWFNRVTAPAQQAAKAVHHGPAILVALRPIGSGTLLRQEDFGWKDVAAAEIRPGQLQRGQASQAEFLGAITRRDFAAGEALSAAELVKPGDRRFLAAVLRPGHRAVSIPADAPNSASGLVLPGDFVDVMLTQNFADNIAATGFRSASETVLHDVRVVAVDRSIGDAAKSGAQGGNAASESRLPKTISLEVSEHDAQALLVAMQLGKLHLAVRSLENTGAARPEGERRPSPVWASEVSQAIAAVGNVGGGLPGGSGGIPQQAQGNETGCRTSRPKSSGSTVERNVRYAPSFWCSAVTGRDRTPSS